MYMLSSTYTKQTILLLVVYFYRRASAFFFFGGGEHVGRTGRKNTFASLQVREGNRNLKLDIEPQNTNALCYHFYLFFRTKVN